MTIPFPTTKEQQLRLTQYLLDMEFAGIDPDFLIKVSRVAMEDQGTFELVEMWIEKEGQPAEQANTMAFIVSNVEEWLK